MFGQEFKISYICHEILMLKDQLYLKFDASRHFLEQLHFKILCCL